MDLSNDSAIWNNQYLLINRITVTYSNALRASVWCGVNEPKNAQKDFYKIIFPEVKPPGGRTPIFRADIDIANGWPENPP